MTERRKYQLMILGTALLFAYVLLTEVADRWKNTYVLFTSYQEKKQAVLNPEKLAEKKMNLLSRKRELGSLLTGGGRSFDQSETGVFEYVNANAKETGIRFESLIPIPSERAGQIKEIGFKINCAANYHQIGRFINAAETGAMLVRINKIALSSQSSGSPLLQVNIEGAAYILSQR
jgi:Tfp pilus assembly protein PilO